MIRIHKFFLKTRILWVIPPKFMRPSLDESDLKLGRGRRDSEGQVRIFGFFLHTSLDRDG